MEFIHASGNVHLSSMDKQQPNYDEFNKNRYLGSRRYLGVEDKMIIDLKEEIKLQLFWIPIYTGMTVHKKQTYYLLQLITIIKK